MTTKKDLIPQIKENTTQPLSRDERFFNSRINKIKELKENIEKAKTIMEEIQKIGQTEFATLSGKLIEEKIRFIRILDRYHDLGKYFRKKEKEKMAIVILDNIEDLPYQDEELEALEKKYNLLCYGSENPSFDRDDEDFEGEDADFSGFEPGSIFDKIFKMMHGEEETEHPQKEKKGKAKSASQLKKEEKKKVEEAKLSKTSRTLYTELVKVLHPDREQDEAIKEQKTEIMKRVTEAYEKDDYFELMRLQLEYLEGIGGGDIQKVSKDKLKYYNKILLEQKRALEEEWRMLTSPFSPIGNTIKEALKNPSFLKYKAKRDKAEMNKVLKGIKNNNDLFEEDKKYLREYLKEVEIHDTEPDIEDLLSALFRR